MGPDAASLVFIFLPSIFLPRIRWQDDVEQEIDDKKWDRIIGSGW